VDEAHNEQKFHVRVFIMKQIFHEPYMWMKHVTKQMYHTRVNADESHNETYFSHSSVSDAAVKGSGTVVTETTKIIKTGKSCRRHGTDEK